MKRSVVSLVLLALGCGGVHRPAESAGFELDPAQEINDEDVRKAFEARPQLGERVRVAYYCFDPARADDIGNMLAKIARVESSYRIPPLLVTGRRRFQEEQPWQPPREVSVKKLRLLAARAHADLLLVIDVGHRRGGVNGWVALTPLLLPVLFVPFIDNTVESYAEVFAMDVRNGYLYGHLVSEERGGEPIATIYATPASEYVEAQWTELLAATSSKVTALLEREARKPVAPAPAAPPMPAGEPAGEPAVD
jgi:hypothetical protein